MTDRRVIRTYEELIAALRDRRKEMGISQIEMDERIGWPEGYTSKVESPMRDPSRGRGNFRVLGPKSLPELLQALGLELVAVNRARGVVISARTHTDFPHAAPSVSGGDQTSARMREIALRRWARTAARKRSQAARQAAMARWWPDKKKPPEG